MMYAMALRKFAQYTMRIYQVCITNSQYSIHMVTCKVIALTTRHPRRSEECIPMLLKVYGESIIRY